MEKSIKKDIGKMINILGINKLNIFINLNNFFKYYNTKLKNINYINFI